MASAVPGLSFGVTGNNRGVDLASLPRHPGVEYTGYVQDVRPLIAQTWASVVPLRIGGGTRLKILEAMALGTPVVSTSKGAEGLDVVDGQHLVIADTPEEFARRTVELLRSPDLRASLAVKAQRLVKECYDWAVVGEHLNGLVDQIDRSVRG